MRKVLCLLVLAIIIFGSQTSGTSDFLIGRNINYKGNLEKQLFFDGRNPNSGKKLISGKLSVHFIDVGQGDSILVVTPSGKAILIDAATGAQGSNILSYINSYGIKEIDMLIATHPHDDHIGGMNELIRRVGVHKTVMPDFTFENPEVMDFMNALKSKKIPLTTVHPGDSFKLDNVLFTIFAPNGKQYDNINDYSLVTKMAYGRYTVLLAGDAQFASEDEMLSGGWDLKADVLKIAHHGSEGSSGMQFLKAVSPRYTVISVGKHNAYGHPHDSVLNRIKDIGTQNFRTDLDGSIVFFTDGNSMTVKKYRNKSKRG